MCRKQIFFKCSICGNFMGSLYYSGNKMICCGKEMDEVVPNTVDASAEKHVPYVEIDGQNVTVTVGTTLHPSVPEHYIEWIYLLTCSGGHRACIKPGDKPQAKFILAEGETPTGAYGYCNLHGLWKKDI
ncbi:MAG: desulfoferrodoxin family protein [Clostridia bacterium]|nr:desulfoferrodoxin family protein [Clostridia bacterium]